MNLQSSFACQRFVEQLQTVARSNSAGDIEAGQFKQPETARKVTLAGVRDKLRMKRASEKNQLAADADPRITDAISDIVDASQRAKAGKRRLSSELDQWRKRVR